MGKAVGPLKFWSMWSFFRGKLIETYEKTMQVITFKSLTLFCFPKDCFEICAAFFNAPLKNWLKDYTLP